MKRFIRICQQWLDRLCDWLNNLCDKLCGQAAAHMERKEIEQHSFREYALEDQLNNVRLDNKYLQLQLTKTRADLYELQRKPQGLRDVVFKILLLPNEELRESSPFSVRRPESGPSWGTVTGFCCLGGCDMDVYPFPSERDALLFAALLKAVGYQPPHNAACPECYQKYMSEQLQGGIDTYVQ